MDVFNFRKKNFPVGLHIYIGHKIDRYTLCLLFINIILLLAPVGQVLFREFCVIIKTTLSLARIIYFFYVHHEQYTMISRISRSRKEIGRNVM